MPPKGSKRPATAKPPVNAGGDSQETVDTDPGPKALPLQVAPAIVKTVGAMKGPLLLADEVNEETRRDVDKRGRAQRPLPKPEWDIKRPREVVANNKSARGANARASAQAGANRCVEKGVMPRCETDGQRLKVDPVTLDDMRQRIAERGPRLRAHLQSQVDEANSEEDEEFGVPDRLALVRRAIRELDRAMQGLEETRPDVMRTWNRFGEYFRAANAVETPIGPLRTVALVGGGEAAVHAGTLDPPLPDMDGPWLGRHRRQHKRASRAAVAQLADVELPEEEYNPGVSVAPATKVMPVAVEQYGNREVRQYLPDGAEAGSVTNERAVAMYAKMRLTAEKTRAAAKAMKDQLDGMHGSGTKGIGHGCNLEPNMLSMVTHKAARLKALLDEVVSSVDDWLGEDAESRGGYWMWRDPVYMATVEAGVADITAVIHSACMRRSEEEQQRLAALMLPPATPPPSAVVNGEADLYRVRQQREAKRRLVPRLTSLDFDAGWSPTSSLGGYDLS